MRLDHGGGNLTEGFTDIPVIKELFDSIPNINDKYIVVPNNELWHINFFHAIFSTTATIGNRALTITVTNAKGNLILTIITQKKQEESLVKYYTWLQGSFVKNAFVNNEIYNHMPSYFYITPGSTIRIFEEKDIDDSDDLTISMQYKCYVGG